jgi:hypothetical protein
MEDPSATSTTPPPSDPAGPETTLTETARSSLADLAALDLPGASQSQQAGNAVILDRLAEELAEAAAMLRALPGRPREMSGHDYALLAALRTAHAAGEDVGETIARTLARLAGELGGARQVLANRPGSWEASSVRELLRGTVGPDDENLPAYGPGAGGSL